MGCAPGRPTQRPVRHLSVFSRFEELRRTRYSRCPLPTGRCPLPTVFCYSFAESLSTSTRTTITRTKGLSWQNAHKWLVCSVFLVFLTLPAIDQGDRAKAPLNAGVGRYIIDYGLPMSHGKAR